MGRARSSISFLVALALAGAAFAVVLPSAQAARRATRAEAAAIKRVGLKKCTRPDCRFLSARVSTRNARFAWGAVVGEGFSGVLVKRPSARSNRFRVVGIQGGGIGECRYWRARAPRAVLRDLHVTGLLNAATGRVGSCG